MTATESVLITGASSDIGCELIRQLASKDRLILAHFNQSTAKLDTLRNSLQDLNLVPIQADFSQNEDVSRLIATISSEHSCPDKIVHLPAPKFEYHRFKEITWEIFQQNLDVQLRSIVRILHAFLPLMAQKKKGKVVFVLSSCTINIPPGSISHYVTTKYALLGLARALAAEYSAKQLNINAVSPSMVETAFLQNLPERMVEIAAGQSPWQRNATPQDVVGMIRFLLSSEATILLAPTSRSAAAQFFDFHRSNNWPFDMSKTYLESDWVGRKAERRVQITAEMLDQFIAVSGDTSAIHVSEQGAKARGFPDRVVHGMLLGALVSGLVGTELPGDDGVLQQMQLSFRAPCHPGDEILIRLSVAEFFESVQTMMIDVKITKASNVTLATGRVQSGLR